MTGLVKINRLVGVDIGDYQVNFTSPGKSYARSFDHEHLVRFLVHDVGVDESRMDPILNELRSAGNALIEGVHFPETDLAPMGFEQVPTDF